VQITVILLSVTLSVIWYTDDPLSSIQPNNHNVSEAGNNNDDNNNDNNDNNNDDIIIIIIIIIIITGDKPRISWWAALPWTLALHDGKGDHWE